MRAIIGDLREKQLENMNAVACHGRLVLLGLAPALLAAAVQLAVSP